MFINSLYRVQNELLTYLRHISQTASLVKLEEQSYERTLSNFSNDSYWSHFGQEIREIQPSKIADAELKS